MRIFQFLEMSPDLSCTVHKSEYFHSMAQQQPAANTRSPQFFFYVVYFINALVRNKHNYISLRGLPNAPSLGQLFLNKFWTFFHADYEF